MAVNNVNNALKGYSFARSVSGADMYKAIGAGNNSVLGIGRKGDYLDHLIVTVVNNLNCQVTIQDGGDAAITVVPNVLPLGNQVIAVPLGLSSRNNNWTVACNAGASAVAAGVW